MWKCNKKSWAWGPRECQGGYELRIIYCEKKSGWGSGSGDPGRGVRVEGPGRGCQDGYEVRTIRCENAKKSGVWLGSGWGLGEGSGWGSAWGVLVGAGRGVRVEKY